jgi:hypothetical protein
MMYFTFEPDGKGVGPLKDVCVESEFGDIDKPTLKNAKKVEQFIILQLQTILTEKLVYPRMVLATLAPKHGAAAGAAGGGGGGTGASSCSGAAGAGGGGGRRGSLSGGSGAGAGASTKK